MTREGAGAAPPALRLVGARVYSRGTCTRRILRAVGGRIVSAEDCPESALELDLDGCLILPGLVNAHDHLHLNGVPRPPAMPRFGNSYEWIDWLQPWLRSPAVVDVVAEPLADRAWQGALKNLLAGTTLVMHHDAWIDAFDEAGFPVGVVRRYGWSHSLGLADTYGPRPDRRPRDGTPWFIHLAEGVDDVARAELDAIAGRGLLDADTVLVHGLALDATALSQVGERGAGLVWCPASNLELFGATLNGEALDRVSRVALGTDSRLTGARDLLAEMRVAAAAGLGDPPALLRLITDRAADLVGQRDRGHLEAGAAADFIVLADTGGEPGETLLGLARSDLLAVVREGRAAIVDEALAHRWPLADPVPVRLDGRRKIMASAVWRRASARTREPGLERV